jgi:hypothetical protein
MLQYLLFPVLVTSFCSRFPEIYLGIIVSQMGNNLIPNIDNILRAEYS